MHVSVCFSIKCQHILFIFSGADYQVYLNIEKKVIGFKKISLFRWGRAPNYDTVMERLEELNWFIK